MQEASPSLTTQLADWLIHRRWWLIVVAIALTAAGAWPSTQLAFDAAIVNLFPPDDPVLTAYLESQRLFGGDEVVVVAYTDPDVLTLDGLRRADALADRFRKLSDELDAADPPIRQVVSVADGRWPIAPLDNTPLVDQVERRGIKPAELRATLLDSAMYRNLLLGEDGRTTAITLALRPKHNDVERHDLIVAIRAIAADTDFETVVAGGPTLTHDASFLVHEDSRTLGWTSSGLLLVVIGVLFRRLRWIALPMAVVHATLVWTKSLLWLFSAQLSMVSTTLTALVTVVGVASVVQVTARYREERERADRTGALRRTMAATGPAVFWASLTTAAGFGSLVITSIVPVQNFSIMLTLASLLVFVATAAFVPAVVLFGRQPRDPAAVPGERHVERLLETTMEWSLHRPWHVGLAALGLLAFTLAGLARIRTETDFTRNFRESSDVVRAYNFVEDRLGGVGAVSLEFVAPEGLTPDLIERLRQLESRLRGSPDHPHLTKVLGLVDVFDFFDVGWVGFGGRMLDRVSPMLGTPSSIEAKLALLQRQRPELVRTFWNEAERTMRVILRARERTTSAVKNELIASVERTAREVLEADSTDRRIRVTGTYTLLNHLVGGLMADQVNTFLLATVAVFSIMCLALRSFKLALVGLVPKLGPILMVLGAMGWLGVPIDMGTPMIASVSMGISVGFSIHYLYRFRQELAAGAAFDQALRATHRRVGGAMVFSNLALVIGFAVLTLSNFVPTIHFSLLADVALVGGLAGNLLVLPLLLRLVCR